MKLVQVVFIVLLSFTTTIHADYSRDQSMTVASLNSINIAYTTVGNKNAPAVLMVMGLTGSHRLWGEDLIDGLVDAGYRVILFDNRDTGESARLNALGEPTLWWQLLKNTVGLEVDAPYSLNDMAADGVAVLDELGIVRAHIVGASMGGMIAQIIAAEYPNRAESLVSIMSTTGAPHLPSPESEAQNDLQGIADTSEEGEAKMHKMGIYPKAMPRQLMAIISAGDRSEQVRSIEVPTLVLHGEDDTLLPPPHGAHTHELIAGSKYITYAGMGHNMPPQVVPELVVAMTRHFAGNQ